MKTVTVRKKELKAILHKNRSEHSEIYAQAQAKYLDLLGKELENQLALLEGGKRVDLKKITNLIVPRNFTKEYDRALLMLDMEQNDVITLDHVDFRRLVQDEWEWSQQWAVSNSGYTSSPKFQPHLGDE